MNSSFKYWFWIIGCVALTSSCKQTSIHEYPVSDLSLYTFGRTAMGNQDDLILITPAAGVTYDFKGDSCIIWFKNLTGSGQHGYIVIELDSVYNRRIQINDTLSQRVSLYPTKKSKRHRVAIIKATEASTGDIAILKIAAQQVYSIIPHTRTRIEFIGNSITCGMGNDTLQIPCGQGNWYDQHNAYYSYASIASRALDMESILSSVSGIGIYRCWDVDCPGMPDVYENLWLGTDETQKWDFMRFTPDIVSICLGTNDLSDGDGVHERKPFDSTIYIRRYIDFINAIFSHYPNTQIVLLTSPMLNGTKATILYDLIKTIANRINALKIKRPPIKTFYFLPMQATGCSGHPDKAEHQVMADQLIPFLKKMVK